MTNTDIPDNATLAAPAYGSALANETDSAREAVQAIRRRFPMTLHECPGWREIDAQAKANQDAAMVAWMLAHAEGC